ARSAFAENFSDSKGDGRTSEVRFAGRKIRLGDGDAKRIRRLKNSTTNAHKWTNADKLLFRDEVFQIVGCAIEVLNTLGHGIVEKPYENALVVEFGLQKIPSRQQPMVDVLYKGQQVGLCVRELIAFDSIVVDTKVIDRITDHERA